MAVADDICPVALRRALKTWEKHFAARNQGRKPSRTDVKLDPTISAKYAQYDRYRASIDAARKTTREHSRAEKHKSPQAHPADAHLDATPVKPTPEMTDLAPPLLSSFNLMDTPQAIRQCLGPTPQKDGHILGLFEDACSSDSPTKARAPLVVISDNVTSTPRAQRSDWAADSGRKETLHVSRTPTSAGKRFMLDTFATPLKRRREEEVGTPSHCRMTVSSTPSFLRRSTLDQLDPLDGSDYVDVNSILTPPTKKRGLARSLSSILQNLRDQEEERLDEELDIFREMEMDAEAEPHTTGAKPQEMSLPEVLVEDSQVVMPLGPDELIESGEETTIPDGALDQNGQPRKVWKKKGLKRQTKRVKMLPRPKTTLVVTEASSVLAARREAAGREDDDEHHDSARDSEDEYDGGEAVPKTGETVTSKKAGRKINALAHTNFCKLKIKSLNAKPKGRGRFGGRR